jgi:Complex I intermediate-associated protein 30 (CIA30)
MYCSNWLVSHRLSINRSCCIHIHLRLIYQCLEVRSFDAGKRGWDIENWDTIDDRVRGGSSESHLVNDGAGARFYGNLDTATLGGGHYR